GRRSRPVLCRVCRHQPVHPDGHPHARAQGDHALAAAPRPETGAVSAKRNLGWRQVLAEQPWSHDFFWALNRHEAIAEDRPRIGDSAGRREEYLDLGQVPHLDFPASAVASYDPKTERDKARLRVKFLGLLGPMGPLP